MSTPRFSVLVYGPDDQERSEPPILAFESNEALPISLNTGDVIHLDNFPTAARDSGSDWLLVAKREHYLYPGKGERDLAWQQVIIHTRLPDDDLPPPMVG